MVIKRHLAKKVGKMINIIFFLIIISFFALPAFGQETEPLLCKNVESKVVMPLKPVKMVREEMTEKECIFYLWYSVKKKVVIYTEKYESEAKASEDLARFSRIFTVYDNSDNPPRHRYKIINKDKYWNEAIVYKDNKTGSFILLRYRNYMITILSPNYNLMKKTELLLRDVRFENY